MKYLINVIALLASVLIFMKLNIVPTIKEEPSIITAQASKVFLEKEKAKNKLSVRLLNNKQIETMDIEEYIIGVVACEMPASFHNEALKALAVAARTYALKKMNNKSTYDLENSTNHQCYNSKLEMKEKWNSMYDQYYEKVRNAVYSTSNEILTYNDEIILALYFSTSNGYTENVENVFSQKLDYLVSVPSPWDKNINYYTKTKTIPVKDFLTKLKLPETSINSIEINRYNTNNVKTIKINNKTYTGVSFQYKLILNSLDYSIKYDETNVYITTKGWGHSVGLSQYGADGMAREGYTYDQILSHYYTNVKIKNV